MAVGGGEFVGIVTDVIIIISVMKRSSSPPPHDSIHRRQTLLRVFRTVGTLSELFSYCSSLPRPDDCLAAIIMRPWCRIWLVHTYMVLCIVMAAFLLHRGCALHGRQPF